MKSGDVVANRFVIESLAGEGGMGEVYRALDRDRDAVVALKIFRTRAITNEKEARTLIELVHPNVVRCIAFGTTEDGDDFLATEWLDGETLRARLSRGAIPLAQSIRIARRVAEGLAAAHTWGITHRDVTPANVMLVGDAVKLIDFGLAVHGNEGTSAGTVGYASPEQARGDPLSPRADVFSLGCVVYECLLGEKPFAAETDVAVLAKMLDGDTARVTTRLTGVPSALVRLVARMLASDPEQRPHDASAVAAELAALEEKSATSVVPSSAVSISVTDAEARASQVLVCETSADDATYARLSAELVDLGARVTRDRTRVTCVWQTETSAVERAVRGARAAIVVRRFDARARASLASSTGAVAAANAAVSSLPTTPSIRVDTDTARLLGDRFVVRPDTNDAFGELVLVREGANPHSRTSLLGHETHCVGRDREIGLVVSTFEECTSEPDARVVWVTGAPGIGKTRVRDEVITRIVKTDSPPRVWSAQADPTRAGVVLGVLADLVRSASAISDGDDEHHARIALESRGCARIEGAERARVVEFLSELLRLPIADASSQLRAAREEPILMGDQIRRAFEDLALAELSKNPLAIVVEDLQWADAASVRALSDVARVSRDKPLFLFLLGRPEAKDTLLRLVADRHPTGVALGKLGAKAMEKLVATALAGAEAPSVDAALVASIAARAGGNPFFAEELVRAAATGAEPMAALAMLESRLTSLEPEARRVLRAASVFGQQFVSSDVAVLLGDSEQGTVEFVDAWCAWLAEREVLSQSGGVWSFRHALVRDAAYAMLTDADRRGAHLLAAELLEHRASRAEGPVIADHFARAGEPDRASRWLASSAAEALEANDLTACIDLGERAIASPTERDDEEWRGELLVVLAEARRWRGEYERCAACAREAVRRLPEGTARFFRAVGELAAATGTVGPPEEFEVALAKLAIAPRDDAASRVAASIACSRAAMHLITRGDPRGDALLARADASADSDLARGRAHQAYAFRAGIGGDLEEIVRRYEESTRAFEAAGDLRTACVHELNAAAALCELGRDDEARVKLAHGAREAEARGLSSAVALAHHLAGIVRSREGDFEQAAAEQRLACETFAAQGNTRMEGGVRCHHAEALLKQKKLAEALAEAERAIALLAKAAPARVRALAVLAHVHVARGDAPAALAASKDAIDLADTAGVETGEALLYSARAAALELAHAREDARAIRERGREKLRARAKTISSDARRESFLRVPENAALLAE